MIDDVELYLQTLKSRFEKIKDTGYKYHLSYSGGKDSHLLFWFIKEFLKDDDYELYLWGLKNIFVVACNTYLEHPEILQRMQKNSDRILKPTMKPLEIKEKFGIPCFSKEQDFYIYYYQSALRKGNKPSKSIQEKIDGTYHSGFNISKKAREYVKGDNAHPITHLCCEYLKKEPFKLYEKETNTKAIMGVRGNESLLRKKQYTSCFTKDNKFTPIYDLTNEILEGIIKRYNIEVPKVYEYVNRTGCMGCPYGSWKGETQKALELITPEQRKFVYNYFRESYKVLGVLENIEKTSLW